MLISKRTCCLPATLELDNKITVALYFHRLSGPGGAERMICQLANALAERDFRVRLISWDKPSAQPYYPLSTAVEWTKLDFRSGLRDKLRRTHALRRMLKESGVDILVGFVMSADKTIYAAAKLAGVSLVVAERNAPAMYWLRYPWWQRWLCFAMMHMADRVTVQMPGFVRAYPASLQARIKAISNPVPGITVKSCPAQPSVDGRYTLLAVTRFDDFQKRVTLLIDAFARIAVRHPQWDLHIVGEGEEADELHRMIKAHGLDARVFLKPSSPDVFAHYAQAHLFAIPSLWEGFPNALAEAMSHGMPAVGFAKAQGVADLIADAGWLADGRDGVAEYAAALEVAMLDNDERTRRGLLAAERMKAFPADRQYEEWASLLRALATRS